MDKWIEKRINKQKDIWMDRYKDRTDGFMKGEMAEQYGNNEEINEYIFLLMSR